MTNDHVCTKLPGKDEIRDVEFKLLRTFPDQRGFFREIIRFNDPFFEGERFAQWSHSKMQRNVVKAWHYHHVQIDWWYVPIGHVLTVLFDNRAESPTYRKKLALKMGDAGQAEAVFEVCVKIPPGVLHGCKVLSDEAHLLYITSETYNPNEEGRFPYNDATVPHNWGDDAITAENDRRRFVPVAKRITLTPN